MPGETFERVYFDGAGCQLSALVAGDPEQPAVVVLHGMRDHAVSMTFLRDYLPGHRFIALDLRGHGDSDHPGTYFAPQMVADLKKLQHHFALDDMVLVGHSLGGHIVSRFSVLYPEVVSKLVMLDGMGPPGMSGETTEDSLSWYVERWQDVVERLAGEPREPRVMPSFEDALERFRAGNPGLSEARAKLLVETGTKPVDGGLRWKFASGLEMFWMGMSTVENEATLGRITCPVLIVTGEHSLAYWSVNRPGLADQTAIYESELERRRQLFRNATHMVLPGAGHMLHYDQPDALGEVVRDFLLD